MDVCFEPASYYSLPAVKQCVPPYREWKYIYTICKNYMYIHFRLLKNIGCLDSKSRQFLFSWQIQLFLEMKSIKANYEELFHEVSFLKKRLAMS